MNIATNPGSCTINISGLGTYMSLSSGYVGIGNISRGSHVLTVSKEGYQTYTETINVVANFNKTITLQPSPVICTPGDPRCIGNDLYRCNATGTAWVLEQKNAPYCISQSQIPDIFTDFPGWLLYLITSGFEAILGFVNKSFVIFLIQIKNFIDNFSSQLAVFIQDPIKYLRGWLDGIYTTMTAVTSEIAKNIWGWLNTGWTSILSFTSWLGINIWKMLNTAWSSLASFITWITSNIWGWLNTGWTSILSFTSWLGINIWKMLNTAWSSLASFITWITSNIWGWLNTAWTSLASYTAWLGKQIQGVIDTTVSQIKTWAEEMVKTFTEALATEFFTGLTRGIKTAHHSPFDADKPTTNDILIGLQRYMKKYREDRDKKKV